MQSSAYSIHLLGVLSRLLGISESETRATAAINGLSGCMEFKKLVQWDERAHLTSSCWKQESENPNGTRWRRGQGTPCAHVHGRYASVGRGRRMGARKRRIAMDRSTDTLCSTDLVSGSFMERQCVQSCANFLIITSLLRHKHQAGDCKMHRRWFRHHNIPRWARPRRILCLSIPFFENVKQTQLSVFQFHFKNILFSSLTFLYFTYYY